MSGHIGKNQKVNKNKELGSDLAREISTLEISQEALKLILGNQPTKRQNKYKKDEGESSGSPEKGL